MSLPVSNNEIRFVKSLERKKSRDENGMFVVEGEKIVEEALRSSFEVVRHYRMKDIGVTAMERMSLLSSPSPALAVLRKPENLEIEDLSYFALPENGLFLALDGIRDPGNLGTILRIADWFGIRHVLCSEGTADVYNPKCVQSCMGALARVEVYYCPLPEVLRETGMPVFGTFLDGENIYGKDLETGVDRPVLVITGSEADGISPEVAATVTDRLYLPPYPPDDPGSESLNAAVATALTLAEFRRRI